MVHVTVYRHHSKKCPHRADRYSPRCNCVFYAQYMEHGKQRQRTLDTRNRTKADTLARDIERKLESGEKIVLKPEPAVTVRAATTRWLAFRHQTNPDRDDTAPAMMVRKLVRWCEEVAVPRIDFLKDIDSDAVYKFRQWLPFRTGDSSSLKVHWSIIGGFFSWAAPIYKVPSPVLSTRGGANPQFRIRFRQRKVVPPTISDITKILNAAEGKLRVLCLLQRWTGMALADAVAHGETNFLHGNVIEGERVKTGKHFRVTINDPDCVQALVALGPRPFRGDRPAIDVRNEYRRQMRETVCKKAGVKMTPHSWRHFRVSEWRSIGIVFEDIAEWTGTSAQELEKTYSHLTTPNKHRLDKIQRDADAKLQRRIEKTTAKMEQVTIQ